MPSISLTVGSKLEGESRCASPVADSAPEVDGDVECCVVADGSSNACVVLDGQTSGTTKARFPEISGEALVTPCPVREEGEGNKAEGTAEDDGRRAPAALPKVRGITVEGEVDWHTFVLVLANVILLLWTMRRVDTRLGRNFF